MNRVDDYLSNPYFDGVISPITTQGEVTVNLKGSRLEYAQRKLNTRNANGDTYPGGDDDQNLLVMPFELVFAWKKQQLNLTVPGTTNLTGFSSLNGVNYKGLNGLWRTEEELEDALIFMGLAKTPYVHASTDQLKHGFTAFRVGSGTTFNTGTKEIFPGDKIVFKAPVRPDHAKIVGEAPNTNSRYGKSIPSFFSPFPFFFISNALKIRNS